MKKKILLTYMATSYPVSFLNSKVSCWGHAKITILSGLVLQMRREPQDDQRHTEEYKKNSESYVHSLP